MPASDPEPEPRAALAPPSAVDSQACAQALRLLGAREHSRLELSRKLAQRGLGADTLEPLLDWLEASGALDEARLAESYIHERVGKGFGPLRIRHELREKGLAETLIQHHLAPMTESWPSLLAAAAHRRFGATVPHDRAECGKRARFLAQRGFPADLIGRYLRLDD